MTARAFRSIFNGLRPPTPQKVLDALRTHGVRDTESELSWFFGLDLSRAQLEEFVDRAKEQRLIDRASVRRQKQFASDHRVRP